MATRNPTHAFAGASAPSVRLRRRQGVRAVVYALAGRDTYLTRCGRYVERHQLADATRGERATCAACARGGRAG